MLTHDAAPRSRFVLLVLVLALLPVPSAPADEEPKTIETQPRNLQDDGKPENSFPLLSIVCSPDGKTLATASKDGTAKLWDLTATRAVARNDK